MIAIVDRNADTVARYTYDPWGKVLSVTNASGVVQTSASLIGNINPIRYRGYYYDTDLGLYYLQSRYYDPETGRFVNGDAYAQTGTDLLDKNMFAYCLDDPVNLVDDGGMLPDDKLLENAQKYAEGHYFVSIGGASTDQRTTSVIAQLGKAVVSSFYLNANMGMGASAGATLSGIDVKASGVHKYVNIKITVNGITYNEPSEMELTAKFGILEIGPKIVEDDNTREDTMWRWSDSIALLGCEIYIGYGVGFEFGFDFKHFLEEVGFN